MPTQRIIMNKNSAQAVLCARLQLGRSALLARISGRMSQEVATSTVALTHK